MQISRAQEEKRSEIIDLLRNNNLPAADLPLKIDDFFIADEKDKIVGVIGMERYESSGLLRSMVVHSDYRNRNIAHALITALERKAIATGVSEIYLLTETADKYFGKKGYQVITRSEVPPEVQTSSEFSHVCPATAIVMKKKFETSE
jgi:amino-acid N-acetyltransferase